MYVHEKANDLSNCAQDAAQACACMASAPKPPMRERLEVLRNMTAEATHEAYGIHDCLFGRDGLNGDTDAEKEPESMDAAVELAAAGTIRSATIQTVDHGKASISVSTKGTIKVARIEARACQLEA